MSTPPSPPTGSAGPATPDTAGQPLVLIVEDEGPIAEALAYVVEDAGYRVLLAPHGKAGLALALQHRPALVFSDVMMPQMGGPEFLRALRAALGDSAPPVVLMTAADVRFAKDAGADSVLKKPFQLSAVEALLRRFLEAN